MSRAMSRQAKRKVTADSGGAQDPHAKFGAAGTDDSSTARKRYSARISSRQATSDDDAPVTTAVATSASSSSSRSTATNASSSPAAPPALTKQLKQSRKGKTAAAALAAAQADMTEEQKREDRARRNRASALKSRNKRRQRLAYLEVEYKRVQDVVEALRRENARLQRENSALRQQQQQQQQLACMARPVAARDSSPVVGAAVAPVTSAPAREFSVLRAPSPAPAPVRVPVRAPAPAPVPAATTSAAFVKTARPYQQQHTPRMWRSPSTEQFMCLLEGATSTSKLPAASAADRAGDRHLRRRHATPLPFVDDIADFEALSAGALVGHGGSDAADDEDDRALWAGVDDATLLCADWISAEDGNDDDASVPVTPGVATCRRGGMAGERAVLERLISA